MQAHAGAWPDLEAIWALARGAKIAALDQGIAPRALVAGRVGLRLRLARRLASGLLTKYPADMRV